MGGMYMPPNPLSKSASYTKAKSKGLHEILQPFDKNNEVNQFLNYVAAKRMNFIAKTRGPKIAKTLPLNKAEIKKYIDFGELSKSAYKKKYKEDLVRKGNFLTGLGEYTKFTQDLLEYQVRSG